MMMNIIKRKNSRFSGTSTATTEDSNTEVTQDSLQGPGDAKIVYFNVDSLWVNYQYVVDMEDELKSEEAGMKARYESTVKQFEKEVKEFQQQAQFMTQQDAQEKQMELQLNEQSIMKLEQSLNTKYVSLKETIAGFQGILSGEYDHLPEQAFYMAGGIEEVLEKAKNL